MDIVTLGAALNGSAEYVNSHFKGGSNIQIVDNPDGTQTINASGEVSSEDTVARADIAAIKDGETLDSFGDVETALDDKADKSTTYTKTEVDTALGSKQNTISDLATIRSGAALGATAVQPETGKGLSTNDYTNDEKSKLAGIEVQANKTTVDSALNGTSTNPVQNKVVKSALDGKQATLTTAQLAAVNSGITSADVEQIETNKNNILLSLIMPFATNNYNVSNLSVKANATIDTSTGIITQTTTDTQTNLRFQMSAFNGNTLVRYLTDNIIMTNNGVYYLTFTKSSDYNTLVFGHNGSAADFKVALPVSALSNGDYIFKINILNCIQGNGAYSFNDIAIVKKTGAYIV
jgi:hypothetical protein